MNRHRRPLIAGNWKMNHGGLSGVELGIECVKLARIAPHVDVVIAPPFTVLAAIAAESDGSPLALAGQSMHPSPSGAYTGEISGSMLKDAGCTWVIVGHSERRHYFGETDAVVAQKVEAALNAGLFPILCVGETLAERDAGTTADVIRRQLSACMPTFARATPPPFAIAYEPVWAIGTGKNASPEEAETVHAQIRGWLRDASPPLAEQTRIVYGGSLKPDNAQALLGCANIDGGLIGGASLDAQAFGAIAHTAESIVNQGLSRPS